MRTIYVINESWLSYYEGGEDNTTREAKEEDFTTERVAELLDQHAEAINFHDFVGAHAKMAKIIEESVGKDGARKVFLKLLEIGGLHCL